MTRRIRQGDRAGGAVGRCLAVGMLATWMLGVGVAGADTRGGSDADLHAPFGRILAEFVDERGRVAYRDLASRKRAALDAYLDSLAEIDANARPKADRIALWINAYNAHAIKGILEGYSAEGVIARKRFFSWYEFRLAGATRTLGAIEHQVLRAEFDEPRIHFALVCASTSCPVLRREAYRGSTLDRQLDEQMRAFLDDPSRNRFDRGDTVYLSRIFEWFAEDFQKAAGSVAKFIRRQRDFPEDARVQYLEYDWTMNAQPGQRPKSD